MVRKVLLDVVFDSSLPVAERNFVEEVIFVDSSGDARAACQPYLLHLDPYLSSPHRALGRHIEAAKMVQVGSCLVEVKLLRVIELSNHMESVGLLSAIAPLSHRLDHTMDRDLDHSLMGLWARTVPAGVEAYKDDPSHLVLVVRTQVVVSYSCRQELQRLPVAHLDLWLDIHLCQVRTVQAEDLLKDPSIYCLWMGSLLYLLVHHMSLCSMA